MNSELAENLLKCMVRIRMFEEMVEKQFASGEIPGFVHLYIGEEASAAGVCESLSSKDYITSTHRGHGHCIAKGGDPKKMMAELYGKKTGYNMGKGGSMHIASPELGILGANGIVAAGLPIAVGAGMTSKLRNSGRVTIAFFGDGASNQGSFHESVNMAAIFNLPIVFVCENNQYAVGTRIDHATKNTQISKRADSYGIPGISVDGQNVVEVYENAEYLIAQARDGLGPSILETNTWRYRGHFQGEPATYRTKEVEEMWLEKDPIDNARKYFIDNDFLDEVKYDQIVQEISKQIEEAVEYARMSDPPKTEDAMTNVYA